MDEQGAIAEYEDGVTAEAEKDEAVKAPPSIVNTQPSTVKAQSTRTVP